MQINRPARLAILGIVVVLSIVAAPAARAERGGNGNGNGPPTASDPPVEDPLPVSCTADATAGETRCLVEFVLPEPMTVTIAHTVGDDFTGGIDARVAAATPPIPGQYVQGQLRHGRDSVTVTLNAGWQMLAVELYTTAPMIAANVTPTWAPQTCRPIVGWPVPCVETKIPWVPSVSYGVGERYMGKVAVGRFGATITATPA